MTRALIDGKYYDTAKSVQLIDSLYYPNPYTSVYEAVFRTEKGNYFRVYESIHGNRVIAMTKQEAAQAMIRLGADDSDLAEFEDVIEEG